MGWLMDLFRDEAEYHERETPRQPATATQTEPPVDNVLLQALLNNETITREKAMTLPAVAAAVDYISNAVAAMPLKLYKLRAGKVEEMSDDTRPRLLNGDTGDTLNGYQLKKAMVIDYLMGKGGYAYIRRSRNEVTGIFYVEEPWITINKNFDPIYKRFRIECNGKTYEDYEFLKLLRNTTDGASGEGLTVEVSKALEAAYQTLLYQLSIARNGGSKKGFLRASRKLGQSEIDTLKRAWRAMYEDNTENIIVLNNGVEFQDASASAAELQLNENKRTLADEIYSIFHIYPDAERTFKEAIYPVVKAFEAACNQTLLLEKEKKNCYFELDVKEIIRASLTERYNAYRVAKDTGFMTLNEIRRAENMSHIEGMDVINVGLGAVLYDINTHTYYTPNTDTVGNPADGSSGPNAGTSPEADETVLAEMMDGLAIDAGMEQMALRGNPNHDGKTGRFTTGKGGGVAGVNNAEKIAELEAELAKTSRFGAGAQRRKELTAKIAELKGEQPTTEKQPKKPPTAEQATYEKPKGMPITPEKEAQFAIIQSTNPMRDDVHTGIRDASDIKSAKEAFKTAVTEDDFLYPDFTKEDGENALKTGHITVYSSRPIAQGGFVSPSKMMAQDYAGGGKIYEQTVSVDDVAWIDSNEGQLAKRGEQLESGD